MFFISVGAWQNRRTARLGLASAVVASAYIAAVEGSHHGKILDPGKLGG